MGYYVSGNGQLRIKKENLDKAYEALVALNDAPDSAKHGGSFGGGEEIRWFSWMPADLRTLPDAKAVFEALGFEVRDDENGDLLISCYDSKTGQEDIFAAAAAPFIEDNEYEWTGEDGSFWKWHFEDGKMSIYDGRRSYVRTASVSVDALIKNEVDLSMKWAAS